MVPEGRGYSDVGILRTGTEIENKCSHHLQVQASFAQKEMFIDFCEN